MRLGYKRVGASRVQKGGVPVTRSLVLDSHPNRQCVSGTKRCRSTSSHGACLGVTEVTVGLEVLKLLDPKSTIIVIGKRELHTRDLDQQTKFLWLKLVKAVDGKLKARSSATSTQ